MNDLVEAARLKVLEDNASARLDKTIVDLNQSQIDVANGRTAYFERLTIGAGAVITAIVSFLANHAAGLHPEWLLRCSLVSLVMVIVAGLYRSFRYPYYIMQARKAAWIEAALDHQRKKFAHILAVKNPVNVHTGQFINKTTVALDQKNSLAEEEATVKRQDAMRDRLLRECHVAEVVCMAAVGIAMISLVCLALFNF